MALPVLKFVYNHSQTDTAYDFYTGNANWRELTPGVDTVIFTGGGIGDVDEGIGDFITNPTLASGTRSPTIRPSVSSYIIPYTYVESGNTMYMVPLAGNNTNRYVFGVQVSGTVDGNMYLEAWDDITFSTTNSPVLSGTANSGFKSYVNAIRTTGDSPPCHVAPGDCWDGDDVGADYLRGQSYRVGLGDPPVTDITNEMLFYNIYIRLETDSPTFHNTPVLGFRYLYS
jgi:hypothetical protein